MTDIMPDTMRYIGQVKYIEVKIIELEAQAHLVDLLDKYIKNIKKSLSSPFHPPPPATAPSVE